MNRTWDHIDLIIAVDNNVICDMSFDVKSPEQVNIATSIPEMVDPYWLLTFLCALPHLVLRHYSGNWEPSASLMTLVQELFHYAEEELAFHQDANHPPKE